MAVAHISGSSSTYYSAYEASATYSMAVNVGGASGQKFVAALVVLRAGDTSGTRYVSAATYGGNALTVSSVNANASGRAYQLVYGLTTLTGSNNLVVTTTTDNGGTLICGAAWNGIDESAPISGIAAASAENSSPSVTVTSATGEEVIAFLCEMDFATTLTAGSGTSVIDGFPVEVASTRAWYGLREDGASSVNIGGTYPGTRGWSMIGFSLKEGTPPSDPPVLSDPDATATNPTTASVTFDTDSLSDGDVYVRPRIGGSAASAATIISEGTTQATGASNPQTVSVGSLTPEAEYYFDIVQDGTIGESNVITAGPLEMPPVVLYGFDFDTDSDCIFGEIVGALTGIGLEDEDEDYIVRAYDVATGALVEESGTLQIDSTGRLPRWEDAAFADATEYHLVFVRVGDGEIGCKRMTTT